MNVVKETILPKATTEPAPKLRPIVNALLDAPRHYLEIAPLAEKLVGAIWSTRTDDRLRRLAVTWALSALVLNLPSKAPPEPSL